MKSEKGMGKEGGFLALVGNRKRGEGKEDKKVNKKRKCLKMCEKKVLFQYGRKNLVVKT